MQLRRKRHTFQTATIVEGSIINYSYTVRNTYADQAAAVFKCPWSNARNTIWNDNFFQTAAVFKCTIAALTRSRSTDLEQAIRQCNVLQAGTVVKNFLLEFSYFSKDDCACQHRTAGKNSRTDSSYTLRDFDTRQARTVFKGRRTDTGYTV